MHDAGDAWAYIVVYVDDIIVAMKDPKSFFDELQDPDKVGFKMKGVGSLQPTILEQTYFVMMTGRYVLDLKHT